MKFLLTFLTISFLGSQVWFSTESEIPSSHSIQSKLLVDSVMVHISDGPGFIVDSSEIGETYEIICFDTESERIDVGYLFSEPERVAICQQYENDGSDARWPVRTFMNLGDGHWSQVNHFEADRTLSIQENPEVFVRIDSVWVQDPNSNVTNLHVIRFTKMDGR